MLSKEINARWEVRASLTAQSGDTLRIEEDVATKGGRFRILKNPERNNPKVEVTSYAGSLEKAWGSLLYQAKVTFRTSRTPDIEEDIKMRGEAY